MGNLSGLLGGNFNIDMTPAPLEEQVRAAMRDIGLDPPDAIHVDGMIHRFSTNGERRDDGGWYVIYPDPPAAGEIGDWRSDKRTKFRQDIGRELTFEEQNAVAERLEQAKQERQREQEIRHEAARKVAQEIWDRAMPADPGHRYLTRKQIKPHGARVTGDGRLIVPLIDPRSGRLESLQYIPGEGKKMFHSGCQLRGGLWNIGKPDRLVYVCEGFATAASVREASGAPVVVAYSKDRLKMACVAAREQLGTGVEIVIVADNDESGDGFKRANEAAKEVPGVRVILPPTLGDANDYAINGGDLGALLRDREDPWLVDGDTFSEQPAPTKWRVKRWIPRDSLIMVHGPSGGGKTFVVLDMCLHIAAGLDDWRGNKVRQCQVAYLAGEGVQGLKKRARAWRREHGMISTRMISFSQHGVNLNKPDGYSFAIRHLRSLPSRPGLIVVDTLHRHLSGDENSAQDTKTMLDACAGLMREFECAVLLVHHTGNNEEAQHRARGSSAWRGALDIEISVVPGKGDRPIQIVQRKAKDIEIQPSLWAEIKGVQIDWVDEDGEPETSAVLVPADEPEEQRKQSKLEGIIQRFGNAVEARGELREDGLFISTSELQDYLLTEVCEDGGKRIKASTAGQWVKPSYSQGMAGKLIDARIISNVRGGFLITDEGARTQLEQRVRNRGNAKR